MKKIKLKNGEIAIIDDRDFKLLSLRKWHLAQGYVVSTDWVLNRKIRMHRIIMDALKGEEVDHINGNKLDNRRENLRICTHRENQFNRKPTKGRRFKGVSFNKRAGKWEAYITKDGVNYHLGLYDSEENGARAYNKKSIELFGQFAKLNDFVS